MAKVKMVLLKRILVSFKTYAGIFTIPSSLF